MLQLNFFKGFVETLTELNLCYNLIEKIPEELSNLVNLRKVGPISEVIKINKVKFKKIFRKLMISIFSI